MMQTIRNMILLLITVPLFGVSIAETVWCADFFVDTFDDGDHRDGTPALWTPGAGGGIRMVENGRFVHSLSGNSMSSYVESCLGESPCFYEDVSQQTSFRVDEGNLIDVTLFARSRNVVGQVAQNATLYGGIDGAGNAVLAMSIAPEVTFLARSPTGIDPLAQETSMQFDVWDDQMAVWVWPTDQVRPEAPSAITTIPERYPNEDGSVGFFYRPQGAGTISFDHFETAPVPEPTALTGWLMGMACLIRVLRQRRTAN